MRKLVTVILMAVCTLPVMLTGGCKKEQVDGGVQVSNDVTVAGLDAAYHERIETATFALG